MKDCKGTEIRIGDNVVVASRQGSSQWLTTTKVVGVETRYTTLRPVLETEVSPRPWNKKPMKKHTRKYVYAGSMDAIMVIPKGPEITIPQSDDPTAEG